MDVPLLNSIYYYFIYLFNNGALFVVIQGWPGFFGPTGVAGPAGDKVCRLVSF